MKKLILLFLATTASCLAQENEKIEKYHYGKNGIESIIKVEDGKTIIVSTFNSRPKLVETVSTESYKYYKENNAKNGDIVTLKTADADVLGKYVITEKNNLISLEFHYQKVSWNNGLVEVYENPTLANVE